MKRFNESKISMLLFGFVSAIVLGGGSANADFTFGERVNLGPTVNSSYHEFDPDISADGLSLFFGSNRSGGSGGLDLWVTTRETIHDDWGEPVNLGPSVNSSYDEVDPSISADGRTLFFNDHHGPFRPDGYGNADIWMTTRATKNDPWTEPVNLGPTVNSSAFDGHPAILADGLSLLFTSQRPGGFGGYDIWVTKRATTEDNWDEPVNLGPSVNSSADEADPSISADGSTLYFNGAGSGGSGDWDLWQVSIIPIVDFNGDGIVDIQDLLRLIGSWGQNDPSVDIAPPPFGDGVVDEKDLEVLMSYWGQEPYDPTLLAHWKLDEAEGMVAYDSVGNNDAFVIGVPVWQPTGGQVNGALQLDGVDDCIVTNPVLSPAEGPFSVFAWVKGGVAGQVVISQSGGGVNWLCTDPSEGKLMTDIKGTGRGAALLLSQAVINDGNWHRIGLVWDGSHRTLYLDDVEVAKDSQAGFQDSIGGLYIGTGKAMEAGTYWSGLIDDVRIYNRAVRP